MYPNRKMGKDLNISQKKLKWPIRKDNLISNRKVKSISVYHCTPIKLAKCNNIRCLTGCRMVSALMHDIWKCIIEKNTLKKFVISW